MSATKVIDWMETLVDKYLKMPELRKRAKALGIDPGQMGKVELIQEIQKAQNNTPCFGTSNGQCESTDCCFMPDCLKTGS